ncbi:hypothetical protein M513_04146, partial [Trichuris suis]
MFAPYFAVVLADIFDMLPFGAPSNFLGRATQLVTISLRFNRKFKKFSFKKEMAKFGINVRMATPSGRRIIMRRLLKEKKFIGWGHDPFDKTEGKPLNYP